MNGISVIVCCYNSALRLTMALKYLSRQKTDSGLNWEVIIVNNNSTDNTVETANNAWQAFGCKSSLKIIYEYKLGLSNARETGVKAAQYDLIIFCDDDNLLFENYLQSAFDVVQKTLDAGYGVWGGKTIAYFDNETKVPYWFEKEKSNYVIGKQAEATGDISNRGYIWGAGMIILKELYLKVVNKELPFLLKDRTGAFLSSGGDSEISLRTLIAGYKLYYDEQLSLYHYVSADKLTADYNDGLIKGFAAANTVLNKYKIFIHYISGKRFFLRTWYSGIFMLKLILSKLNIKKLTTHDVTVLHALFGSIFQDEDFNIMRRLLKIRNQIKPQYLH